MFELSRCFRNASGRSVTRFFPVSSRCQKSFAIGRRHSIPWPLCCGRGVGATVRYCAAVGVVVPVCCLTCVALHRQVLSSHRLVLDPNHPNGQKLAIDGDGCHSRKLNYYPTVAWLNGPNPTSLGTLILPHQLERC
jgi:hypothetical protein